VPEWFEAAEGDDEDYQGEDDIMYVDVPDQPAAKKPRE
jgi:hypothetical protein